MYCMEGQTFKGVKNPQTSGNAGTEVRGPTHKVNNWDHTGMRNIRKLDIDQLPGYGYG
jgi:hypothetical protein